MNNLKVKISNGNTKLGTIKSVSLPPVITCRPGTPCIKTCYARRLQRFPNVKNAYEHNLQLYSENPAAYFNGITIAAYNEKYFRWHVSGDIPDMDYFRYMAGVAVVCKNTKFLVFTKKYEIVNEFIKQGGIIPNNLIIIFSVWNSLELENPYNFMVAHVVPVETKGIWGENECTGNCLECAINNKRCWNTENKVVYLLEH